MIEGDYPETLLEATAVHTFLENLGYSKDREIFLIVTPEYVLVRLQAEGKVIHLNVGGPEFPIERMREKWENFVLEWNEGGTMTKEDKDEIFHRSQIYRKRAEVAAALSFAGFSRWVENISATVH